MRNLGAEFTPRALGDLASEACTSGLGPGPALRPQPALIPRPAHVVESWLEHTLADHAPLAVRWYVPADSQARAGVLLPGVGGAEAPAVAAALHVLALRLQAAGFLVLRYDAPGSGDSGPFADRGPAGALRISHHVDAFRIAMAALQGSGTTRTVVVAMRAATDLAAHCAAEVDVQVLWDPLDLPGLRPRTDRERDRRTLVLPRESITVAPRVRAAFLEDRTQWGVARGQDELLAGGVTPDTTAGVISWWLEREVPGTTSTVDVGVHSIRRAGEGAVLEEFVQVGDVLAVRTALIGPATGPTVVLLGSGGVHGQRAGPARAWLDLSSRLAAAGRPVLRLDLPDRLGGYGSPANAAALRSLLLDLDHDDVVICAEPAQLPTLPADVRTTARLVAPRRVAWEPLSPQLWQDPLRRPVVLAEVVAHLLQITAPLPDPLAVALGPDPDDPAFVDTTETLVAAPASEGRSRLLPVTAVVVLGLVVQAVGYALGRAGSNGICELAFFSALLLIFAPCAWRLVGTAAGRRERLAVSGLLGVALVISLHLLSPTIFTGYDEMLHEATLWRLGTQHSLFVQNALLPVSPRYPGLELFTLAVHWCTGVPDIVAQFVVIALARLVLVVIVFLFTERLTGSTRAGSVAVVVYAVSPQFYSFNAAYAYQTLALALGGGALYLVMRAVDAHRRPRRRALALAMACSAGVVVTHHLVGWITVGALLIWWLAVVAAKRRDEVRTVGIAACFALGFALLWTGINVVALYDYLEPILGGALSGILGLIGQHSNDQRALFTASSGIVTPAWQKLLLLVSTLAVLGLLTLGIRAAFRNRAGTGNPLLRGGVLRFLVIVVAASYLGVLGSRLSGPAAELGGRASTFVFFGIAPVVAAWFVARTPTIKTSVATVVASVLFVGGVLFGAASWTYLPGPYMPSADERSVDATSIAAANWAAQHIPIGTAIADDRDGSALMNDIGHLDPVTEAVPGGINVGPLYFDTTWSSYDTALVKQAGIGYLVVDTRLAEGPPAYGVYFEPGETQGPELLTRAQLAKFSSVPGIRAVYTNGPITIYSLAGILGTTPVHVDADDTRSDPSAIAALGRTNWALLLGLVAVAGIWGVRLRRRGLSGLSTDRLLDGLLAATVGAIVLSAVVIEAQVPVTLAGAVVLAVLAGLGLRGTGPARRAGLVASRLAQNVGISHAIRLGDSSRRRASRLLRWHQSGATGRTART